ncbi:hypothetical protein O6H91_18G063400 [Diphasiastrum complanatum]|uniref:Uncharacterized protein n=1 Tax=Diphasiastrum complanatum TaxID=34168 RepID=A0ACC2B386_DIPCM|nr:hypothetical protein O6H91_18G063400 [Diphasiastrum complanatum]
MLHPASPSLSFVALLHLPSLSPSSVAPFSFPCCPLSSLPLCCALLALTSIHTSACFSSLLVPFPSPLLQFPPLTSIHSFPPALLPSPSCLLLHRPSHLLCFLPLLAYCPPSHRLRCGSLPSPSSTHLHSLSIRPLPSIHLLPYCPPRPASPPPRSSLLSPSLCYCSAPSPRSLPALACFTPSLRSAPPFLYWVKPPSLSPFDCDVAYWRGRDWRGRGSNARSRAYVTRE